MSFNAEYASASPREKKFNIDAALDNAPFSLATACIIVAIALAVVLEAVSNNLLGLAIPELVDAWQQPREAFKYAVTFSMAGMAAGAFISGFIADKTGRRAVILASLLICGFATLAIGRCSSILPLTILRFFCQFRLWRPAARCLQHRGGIFPAPAADNGCQCSSCQHFFRHCSGRFFV